MSRARAAAPPPAPRPVSRDAPPARCCAVAALALAACGDNRSAAAGAARLDAAPRRSSTATATGSSSAGPGEPLRDRGDAAPLGATLATFAQLTDTHVRDEESPARVPFLDRVPGPFTSTFRPQEAFSAQVLDASVRARQPRAPAGRVRHRRHHRQRPAQRARPRARRRCAAASVKPDSGAPGYDGVQAPDSADPFYYRPDHDAPAHPGALARRAAPVPRRRPRRAVVRAGRQPRRARAGRGAADAADQRVRGRRPARAVARPRDRRDSSRATSRSPKFAVDAALDDASGLETIGVPADPRRRLVAPGRGRAGARRPPRPSISGRGVRAITVDTVNRDGTSQARVTPAQIDDAPRATARRRRPLGRRVLAQPAAGRGARRARRTPARRRRDLRQLAPQPDPARGRYWLISTSSLADFPQQARMFRLRETAARRRARDLDGRPRRPRPGRDRARARVPRRAGRTPATLRRRTFGSKHSALRFRAVSATPPPRLRSTSSTSARGDLP